MDASRMKGLPSAGNAAYSDTCEHSGQRMGNPQWKEFPQLAVAVELTRASLIRKPYMRPRQKGSFRPSVVDKYSFIVHKLRFAAWLRTKKTLFAGGLDIMRSSLYV